MIVMQHFIYNSLIPGVDPGCGTLLRMAEDGVFHKALRQTQV